MEERIMGTMKQFVNKNKIKATSEWANANPNMADSQNMNHFKVTLRGGGRQMTLYFSQGYGISGEPDAASVLNCLASDSASVENARSFDDWASDLGYDPDSRKAEKIFKTCEVQAAKLKKFLGEALYKTLLWDTEGL
jgi:hypothetical protein